MVTLYILPFFPISPFLIWQVHGEFVNAPSFFPMDRARERGAVATNIRGWRPRPRPANRGRGGAKRGQTNEARGGGRRGKQTITTFISQMLRLHLGRNFYSRDDGIGIYKITHTLPYQKKFHLQCIDDLNSFDRLFCFSTLIDYFQS